MWESIHFWCRTFCYHTPNIAFRHFSCRFRIEVTSLVLHTRCFFLLFCFSRFILVFYSPCNCFNCVSIFFRFAFLFLHCSLFSFQLAERNKKPYFFFFVFYFSKHFGLWFFSSLPFFFHHLGISLRREWGGWH